MNSTETIPTIDDLLEASSATADFKQAVRDLGNGGRSSKLIAFGGGNPPVKVLRVISGLLEKEPGLEIANVEVRGSSGCSDYRGEITMNGNKVFRFVWDCAWKAASVGWKDHFGEPDQIRAARTFGYRCFERFEEIGKS